MNAVNNKSNFYTSIHECMIYVDYINNRLKIIHNPAISEDSVKAIIDFAKEEKLDKILINCEEKYKKLFEQCEFVEEGVIKGFFKGTDAVCLSFFVNTDRKQSKNEEIENLILTESLAVNGKYIPKPEYNYKIRTAIENDIVQMIELFNEVFVSYPSPVHNPEYLREAMSKKILFKVAVENEKIIGIASADMDLNNLNAEITDCATDPQYRGRGILPILIKSLENELIEKHFITLYSLSRAINKGINITLSKLGYEYNGRLINNCHICGDFEDMNIWTKALNI